MQVITIIVIMCFLVLLCLSRKEDTEKDTPSLLKPFYKIAMYLYKKGCSRLPGFLTSPQAERDLQQLRPGEWGEYLKTGYYVKKGALSLGILFLGTLFAAAVRYLAESGRILGENGNIARGSYEEGVREIRILADYGQKQLDFQVQVEPVIVSGEEMDELFDRFLAGLPEWMAGENRSLQAVESDLILEEQYEDYPVYVEWESSRPDMVSDTGFVAAVESEESVLLRAHLTYGRYHRTEEIEVTLVPPVYTEEQLLYMEMQEMLEQAQKDTLEQQEWVLPSRWQGETIVWRQLVEDNSLLLWGAAVAAAAAAYLFMDKDLHKQLEQRKESMHREYPEMLHKLVLFVGAGMTIRGAFQKMAGDYEKKRQNGGRESPVYEEMLYTCRELRSGVSEGASYEHFGRRIGLQEYIRLSTLLMQNLKRGNRTLLERLREEADKAAQEQLQQGKKMGEEAGTGLLVPMVMMLAVVMAVIMIPALSNM